MAYGLHIERHGRDISLEEWLSALKSVEGVREKTDDTVAISPKTGEEIRIGRNDGDAEVLITTGGFLGFGRREEWRPAFHFSNGKVSFKATKDIELPKNPVKRAASQIATVLSAKIVGDEGEEYDW